MSVSKNIKILTSPPANFYFNSSDTLSTILFGNLFSSSKIFTIIVTILGIILTIAVIVLSMLIKINQVWQNIFNVVLGIFIVFWVFLGIILAFSINLRLSFKILKQISILYMVLISVILGGIVWFIFDDLSIKIMLTTFFLLCFTRMFLIDASPHHMHRNFVIFTILMFLVACVIQANTFFNFWITNIYTVTIPSIGFSYNVNTLFNTLIFSFIVLFLGTLYRMIFRKGYLVFIKSPVQILNETSSYKIRISPSFVKN